jgi:malonyl-CoA/methylmalonyl-CoA synthetase
VFYHLLTRRWTVPDAVAIEYGDTRLSWRELGERTARAAGWLRAQGLGPGSVLALQLGRSYELLELHLASLATGVATVPINERYTAAEVDYLLADSGATLACVTDDLGGPGRVRASDLRAALDASAPADLSDPPGPDAIAAIVYTSGTTGRPKGAVITHANLAATVTALHEAWRWRSDDVLLHALPLFHIHGLFVAQFGALHAGARTIWMERFDAREAMETLQDRGCTLFMGVPTFYQRFLELPPVARFDLSRMRLFTCGSAALPAITHQAFEDRFGHRILERYGMTEVGIVISNPYDGERRPGAIGLPLPGVRARICEPEAERELPPGEVGELRIAGPSVFRGYLNAPEKTAASFDADGFLRTGDLGWKSADGYFTLVGRSRDLVISGGFNVYPAEVEGALLEHPEVAEAAVVGVFDPDLGERVVATVVPRPGASLEAASALAWAKDRLAPYKRPRRIEIAASLPRNAMGKVQKDQLRAAWERPVVRDARPDEAELLARHNVAMALETEGIALDPATALAGAQAVFSRDVGARYFVAEIAGSFAGQCMVTTEWSDWRDRVVWWLQSVYVAPACRKRGVYRALHEAVISRARDAGAGGLRLYVDRRNQRAAEVYRRVGMNGDHYLVFEAMFDEPPEAPKP